MDRTAIDMTNGDTALVEYDEDRKVVRFLDDDDVLIAEFTTAEIAGSRGLALSWGRGLYISETAVAQLLQWLRISPAPVAVEQAPAPVVWARISAGHYRHAETGVEIVKVAAHREHGYAVGTRWETLIPVRSGSRVYGWTKTLGATKAAAETDNIPAARAEIAEAFEEATEEAYSRFLDEGPECLGDPCYFRAASGHLDACPRKAYIVGGLNGERTTPSGGARYPEDVGRALWVEYAYPLAEAEELTRTGGPRYTVRTDVRGSHGFAVVEDHRTHDNVEVFTGPEATAQAEAYLAMLNRVYCGSRVAHVEHDNCGGSTVDVPANWPTESELKPWETLAPMANRVAESMEPIADSPLVDVHRPSEGARTVKRAEDLDGLTGERFGGASRAEVIDALKEEATEAAVEGLDLSSVVVMPLASAGAVTSALAAGQVAILVDEELLKASLAEIAESSGVPVEKVRGVYQAVLNGECPLLGEVEPGCMQDGDLAYDFRPGDIWRDESLRVTWHVREDTHGAPELFEPNGPGRVPGHSLRHIRGGMKLVSRAPGTDS